MKHVNLLLSALEGETLPEFASAMFDRFQLSAFEERESENYVDGHYFVGTGADLEFKLMKSDEAGHADLPFWIRVSTATRGGDVSAELIDAFANNVIKAAGRKVARLENFGQISERRIDY